MQGACEKRECSQRKEEDYSSSREWHEKKLLSWR